MLFEFKVPSVFPNKTIFWLAFWICLVNSLVIFEEYPLIPSSDQNFYLWTRIAVLAFMYFANLSLALKPTSLICQYLFGLSSYVYCFQGEYFRPNYIQAYFIWLVLQALFIQQSRKQFLTFHTLGGLSFAWWIGENIEKNRIRLQNTDLAADYQTNVIVAIIVAAILFTRINRARLEKDKAQSQILLVGKQAVNIIHDLKNLTAAPQVYLDFLFQSKKELDPDTRKVLQHLQGDLSNMLEKTRDLYRMVQMRGGTSNFESIQSCLDRAISFLSTRLGAVKIERLGDESQMLDPVALELIFLNLFYNSLAAFAKNKIASPRLRIEVKDHKINIQDNAGGMPEDLVRRFNSGNLESRGLGLFLISDAAEAAGYQIVMRNQNWDGERGLCVEIAVRMRA